MRVPKGRLSIHALSVRLLSGCAVAGLLLPAPAGAQDNKPAVELEEIVVTAQRRAERLEDVPQAVVALTVDVLERADVVNIHELGRIAPGVQINYGGLSSQPSIRGVSSLTNGTGNENNVAIYVDGFYVPDNTSINADLANLESIQVLKGPQGTLYGRNATGGAILINTLSPSDIFTGKAEIGYGRFNERRFSGFASGPLSDGARLMVAVASRDSDGHIKLTDPANVRRTRGDAAPLEQRSLRSKLEIDLGEDLQATLAYNYASSADATGVLFTPFAYVPAFLPGGNLRATEFGTASYNYGSTTSSRTHEGTVKLEWATPIGALTAYTGYADRHHEVDYDFDGSYADLTYGSSPADQRTFQQAVDFVVDAIDGVDLVVGGLYLKDKLTQPSGLGQQIFGAGMVATSRVYRPLETEAIAIYADANVHLTDRLSLGLGGRYSHDERFVSQLITNGTGTVLVPYFEDEADFSRFTPRATLRYEVAPRSNIYASYSKGFRSGSFNGAQAASAALNLPIKPEDIGAYEIGFKTAQSLFRFEAAGFYYDYKNLNVSLTVPNPSCAGQPVCSPITVVGNAPKAEIYGIDGQVTFMPVDQLNISLGAAWLHARYGHFPNAIGVGINAAGTGNVSGQTQDWSGQQMSRAPDFSGQVNVDYTVPLWQGDLRLAGNLAYSTGYAISNPSLYGPLAPADLRDKQRFRQGSTLILNTDITWTDPSGQYWITLYTKNLTNESYRLTYNGGSFGDYSAKAAPVSYGAKVGYRF